MKLMNKWYVYIIQTEKNKLYTGVAIDVEKRFLEHLNQPGKKGAKFFLSDKPIKIVFIQEELDRSSAQKLESQIKKLKRATKEILVELYQVSSLSESEFGP